MHKTLVDLCEATSAALLGSSNERLPQILCVFARILGTDLVEEETSRRMVHLLGQIRTGLPQVLQSLPSHPSFALLSLEQKAVLEQAISGQMVPQAPTS